MTLPSRVTIDAGVLLRWMRPETDSKGPRCREIVDYVLEQKGTVLGRVFKQSDRARRRMRNRRQGARKEQAGACD